MKNNVVIVIVDELSNVYLKGEYAKYNLTPFLSSLKEKGFYCDNVFSQGPYTEAALTPFYTGRDNLDFGGNFFRGNQAEVTLFEHFKNNGYDTFNFTQNLIYPKPMARGLTCEKYGVNFFFEAMYLYRLSYYEDKKESLSEKEKHDLIEIINSNLYFCREWFNDLKTKSDKCSFVLSSTDLVGLEENIVKLNEQISCFENSPEQYLYNILSNGLKHELFKIKSFLMINQAENDKVDEILKEYKSFFKEIVRKNKRFNKNNNKISLLKTGIDVLKNIKDKQKIFSVLKKRYYYKKLLNGKAYFKQLKEKRSCIKGEPSAYAYYKGFINYLNEREDKEKPFFAMIHSSSLHTPAVFYSHEVTDKAFVKKEMSVAKNCLDGLDKDFKGNILYALSVRYNDEKLKDFVLEMDELGYSNNTTYIFTADHGSSFMYYPIRESVVNNMYVETYNVPFVVWGKDVRKGTSCGYFTTKDMVYTATCLSGIGAPKEFTGTNVINGETEYAISEYLGGGCPDIFKKELVFAIRNQNYTVMAKAKISEELTKEKVYAVYDRKIDCLERFNKKEKLINEQAVIDLIEKLANRLELIKKQI